MFRKAQKSLVVMAAAVAALALAAAARPVAAAGAGARAVLPRLHSLYVPMPDGVRLAVDVWLPADTTTGSRLPTVLEMDRYWRARAYSGGYKNNPNYLIAQPWNQRGYAYVFADIRGTGASFGTLTAELGRAAVGDAGSLADWIAAQPWSNGRVGVTGVSYAADVAMLSLALRNPHITAAAPISYDFDPYEDLARPGGILIQPLIDPYGLLLRVLDKADGTTCSTSAQTRQLCQETGLTGAAPEPVDGPDGKALRAEARAQHFHNANLVQMAEAGVYRDYTKGPQSWTVASVGSKTAAISAGGVPILTFAGWLDAGTSNGVLSELVGLSNTQESWIGPWSHGQGYIANPFKPSRLLTAAEHRQLADRVYAFFDRYVKHQDRPAGTRVLHYYTLNAGTWHTTTRWPVAGTQAQRLYFGGGHALTRQRPAAPGSDLLRLNPTAGTGHLNRWNTNLTGDPVVYPNRAAVDRKLLTYTSAPLRQATTVTGLGRVSLNVTGITGARHGALYAYLEDVQPSGRVVYITEGELALADRAIAPKKDNPLWRKLRTPRTYARADAAPFPLHTPQQITFDLLPTSVQFHAGDRIRIAIAAADPDSFQLMPASGKATYRINRSATNPSFVDLPVIK
jgi:putative CocE/NonD family hydrolase